MVFEGVLVSVLNHFLSPYVKNLDSSQLKVAIWSGDVLLEKLELKENALDDLNLPIRVFRGYLDCLKLKIPWKNLYSAPIIAEIDGLYVIAGPASAFKYDEEKSAKEKKERKDKQLKRIEEARKKAAEPKDESKISQDPGFVEKLIATMIRNIQITIKNIHIRYEDAVTNPMHPFSFGVTLDSLFVQSTDCQYVVGGTTMDPDPAAMLIYKLLQLNCLALYWQSIDSLLGTSPPDDWMEVLKGDIARSNSSPLKIMHYVVHPITLEARLQVTTKPGRSMEIPLALVQVTLQQVALALSRNQFQDIMGLVESFDRMSINLKFLKYRPDVGVREGPRAWWRYAISAVKEEEVRRKLDMWSWKHIQQHRKWCRQYTESYARKVMAKTITSALQKELDFLEMKLDVFNITICRQLAENKAMVKRRVQEEAEKEDGGGWWGWVTGQGSSGGDKEGEEIIHLPTEEELQEEKERMYEAIGYSENAEVPIYPKEYVAHNIAVQLEEVSVQLWNENGIVAHVLTSSVSAQVLNRPSSKNITVKTTVGRLTAYGLSNGTTGEGGEGPIVVFSKHGDEESLLDLCVDINPVNSSVSQKIKVQLLPIQITYHADTVDAAIAMFMLSKDVHLQKLSAAAASTLEDLKTQGRAGLEHAISQRKLLDLDIVINSPSLVVPQNGVMSESSSVLVADLGRLEIKSDLQANVPDVRVATDAELDEAFYDHFTLSLTRLQLLLAAPKQDWASAWAISSSSLHLLQPTSLDLELKKSLLPNDTRLPNMKVKGELPSLSLTISDQQVKQLLELIQSIPLPPPSLAEKKMQSTSTYSIADQPSHMGTDSIVNTVSETFLIGDTQLERESSEEEYLTASECESDDEGILQHHSSTDDKTPSSSTTKLSLQFAIHEIGILFSEHHTSSGADTPRLHLVVTSLTSDLLMRSWDMQLKASVGNLHITDHYITGPDGEPGTFLSAQLMEEQKFLTFNYSKFDHLAPHYVTEFNSTRQTITASLSLLRLNLHSDSLLNLIDTVQSITSSIKTTTDETTVAEPEDKPQDSVTESAATTSSSTLSVSSSHILRAEERQLQLMTSLVGVEVIVCGSDMGEVMSASVKGMEAHMDMYKDRMQLMASVADVDLLDNEPSAKHKQIIHKLAAARKVISLKVTVFKPSTLRDPCDLSFCDLDIAADVERLSVMAVFSFLGRIQRFATDFLHRLNLNQTTIDSAREVASNTASRTAEALKERSSSRVKLDIIIRAPLLIIPYTPSPSPSLSPPFSPPPTTLPLPQRAFVANLGELCVKNVFKLASDVVTKTGKDGVGREEMYSSQFLSSTGVPAVVDCMTVTISSVQLGRVLDIEKAGIGKSVSGDIHAKSHDISADSHALLWPLEFKSDITRRLSGWCTKVPAVSIACKMDSIQMQFSPLDYQELMCLLQDVKHMNTDHLKEEIAVTSSGSDSVKSMKKEDEEKKKCDKEEEIEKTESSIDEINIHVEAIVGTLELVLYSHVGGVAEVKVKGAAASVDMYKHCIGIRAGISGVEVLDSTPDVVYHKIVSVEEEQSAVEAQVTYYFDATKEAHYDTNKSDIAITLRVNRIRVVALYLFVARILNYVHELHNTVQESDSDVFETLDTSNNEKDREDSHTQETASSDIPMRIKLDVSIRAPEITVPLNSLSHDIVVLDLGQLTLMNEFLSLDVGFSDEQSVALYEQYYIKLTELKLYRSVWDSDKNRPTDCQRDLLDPVTLSVEMQRNLSAKWYHGMPTISIDAQLEPLQIVASSDDIESLCLILNGNLKETYTSVEALERDDGREISAETVKNYPKQHDNVSTKVSQSDSDEHTPAFTELLISARLKSIAVKLYFKDQTLLYEDKLTWIRDEKRAFTRLELGDFQADVKKESSSALCVNLSLGNCLLDDLRASLDEEGITEEDEEDEEEEEGSTRETSVDAPEEPDKQLSKLRIRRMIQKRDSTIKQPLVVLDYNLSPDNDTRVVARVDEIQVLVNLKFIKAIVSFGLESIKPLREATDGIEEGDDDKKGRDSGLHHQVSRPPSTPDKGGRRESGMSMSVNINHPLVALLEDAHQMNTAALVCQMEVQADMSRKIPSNQMSVHSSLSGLSLSIARYPDLDRPIFKPVLGPLSDGILAYMDQWGGTTKISVTVPSLDIVLSPATVRLVLNSIRSLSTDHIVEAEVGETAPLNLWSSKSITRGPLKKEWYLKDAEESSGVAPSSSHLTTHMSLASSITSQQWTESFDMQVANISVLIEQEVTTPALRTFPAISVVMGKYSNVALYVKLQDWSSKLKASTVLYLEASYYNIGNDSWEPILEPIVDPQDESQYLSWGMKAKVVRQPPQHHMVQAASETLANEKEDEEEEDEDDVISLSIDVCAESALQLTVTKSSLGIFTELLQAYTGKKVTVLEEVDTPETYNAIFTVVNKLGKSYPVTVKTASTLKVHGAYSSILRHGDIPLPLHPTEGVEKMKSGELLSRHRHLSRVHIIQLQIEGFSPLDVALGMYERVYYPLTTATATDSDKEMKTGIVVDIDRTAGTPVVTLRSPLQVYNHLDQPVTVYYTLSHAPPIDSSTAVARVLADSTAQLPLNTTSIGFLFIQLPHTGMSQPGIRWDGETSLDIACALTHTQAKGGGHDKQNFSFIHVQLEVEEYSRTPSFPLSGCAHHTIHLHHPLVIHNLLPYSISLGEKGYGMVLIGSGAQANINYTKLSQTKKFLLEVEKKNMKWSGSFMMDSKSDEESPFTVTHDSSNLELVVKKEEKGTWQLSVFSHNWMVNKTGLTLQYRAPEGFFNFGQRDSDVYIHQPKSAIVLYPHAAVCVRVVMGDRCSEWSTKFSLEALGSEGIFSCSFKDSSEELQIGTKVELSQFGTTRILTLSPFYMINNTTRDSISLCECNSNASKIYTVLPGELLPFWPSAGSQCLEVSVGDETMTCHSAPFKFTETGSVLIRTGQQTQSTTASKTDEVIPPPAVMIEIQVTGSANIVSFTPYYPGCVPLQLVNHTQHPIIFKQINGPHNYNIRPSQSLMYTWDFPLKNKQLLLNTSKKTKINPQEDGSGSFTLPNDDVLSASTDESTGVAEGGDGEGKEREEVDGQLEDIGEESGEDEEGERVEEGEGEGEEEAEGDDYTQQQLEEKPPIEGGITEDDTKQQEQGTDEVDFSFTDKIRRLSDEVKSTFGRRKKKSSKKSSKKSGRKVYWVSFMDGLQRVILFTSSGTLKKRVVRGSAKEHPHTEISLSLIGIGLSLVDDVRGEEVAYLGIPQSQKEWQIRVKKLWKPLPHDMCEKLEQQYDPSSQKSKGRKVLPDSDYEVDFNRMYLYNIKDGTKNKLRRSHLEGVYARVTLSEHLTSLNIRLSHIQIDNQLPLALHPMIIYPYPPPPSIANTCATKPFIEGTVVIHKTEQSNINQIQYLQVLIQEVGVNLDMSFLMALLTFFSQLPSSATEAQIVQREIDYAKLPLKSSKVVAVSAAVSRNYFKFLHLSPLIIHLSFSLEMSEHDGEEAKKATERNVLLRMMLNLLLSFATIIGKTKDAELKLRYFQLEDEALTQQALVDRISKHYVQEGVIQMYSVVLGLEVLGNPVGFVRGLKKGTVGLFYYPIQGAVLGPEEFLEGVKLGSMQFVGGTVGGISGVLGKVTGVLGDTAANLTMDEEFQSQRKRQKGTLGQGLEGAAKGMFAGVTGVISQPIKGAKKEGVWGLLKGTGKGVLGLVLRPTGGLIDLTSATFNAVQRKTKVGGYDMAQLRPPRFIGQPKFVSPYSPHKAEGYALFLAVDNGHLREEGDMYFDHVELTENPLKVLLITNNRMAVIKRNALFDRFEEDWRIMLSELCRNISADRNIIVIPVFEEQGWFSKKKKRQETTKHLEVNTTVIADQVVKLVNQAYQEYRTTQTKK